MANQKKQIELLSVHDAFNTAYQFVKKYAEVENTCDYWQTVFEEYTSLCSGGDTLTVRLLNEAYTYLVKTGMEILTTKG